MPALLAVVRYFSNWLVLCVRWHGDLQGWGSYLCKAEELRSLCIHKLPPGFMTRAAAEPILSVHYHSSIDLCVYDGYSVGEIYPTHCRYSVLLPLQQRDARPFQSLANEHQEMTHPDASNSLNPDDSISVWWVKVYYPPPLFHNSTCDLCWMKSLPSVN